jgi:hypothetical protein
MSSQTRKVSNERGAAVVELALVLPILLTVLLGIVEFGRAYNTKISLTHAAREGARAAAVGYDDDEVEDVVKDAATTLPLTDADIDIVGDCDDPGDPIEVSASYDFDFIVPFLDDLTMDLSSTGSMRCGG